MKNSAKFNPFHLSWFMVIEPILWNRALYQPLHHNKFSFFLGYIGSSILHIMKSWWQMVQYRCYALLKNQEWAENPFCPLVPGSAVALLSSELHVARIAGYTSKWDRSLSICAAKSLDGMLHNCSVCTYGHVNCYSLPHVHVLQDCPWIEVILRILSLTLSFGHSCAYLTWNCLCIPYLNRWNIFQCDIHWLYFYLIDFYFNTW